MRRRVASDKPERVWGRGLVDWFLARPRAAWVARWVAVELSTGPLFVVAVAVLGHLLGRAGATAVVLGPAVGVAWLWFRDGIAARQAQQATGLGGRTLQLLAAALTGFGCLLWLVTPVTAGSFAVLCLSWLSTGLTLGAVSALALPGRRTRTAATVLVLALAAAWVPLNRLGLQVTDATAPRSFAEPPRRLMILVDWPGLQPDEARYRAGTLSVAYDDGSPVGTDFDALEVRAAGALSPCAFLLQARADDQELTYSQCGDQGNGLWSSAGDGTGCALVQQRNGLLLLLTDDLCHPDDAAGLETVLHTAHAVGDDAMPALSQ
ncbi:hypothetical protein SAMN05414137_11649 [Streptacidiphilus jiangxiensis]|uniref:Uncharacterized protein n=1 Tax=Streptacidiphilus jiangxiensis TaxID=235985 RepID=A0A1H7UMZ1_STRJI|nr:hypothetical protein SAMN05414137_11649 [Streptacidiphilus jiangxiensis]